MITLEQSKVGMVNKIDQQVIDMFRRASWILDRLPFDNAVSPATGGSTMVYGYQRLLTPSTANFREINVDYVANEAIRQDETVKLKVFGGDARVDRILEHTAAVSEMGFQLEQKIIAATNLFHHTFINGDKTQDPLSFDGLDIMLTGSSTEKGTDSTLDLSIEDMTNAQVFRALEKIDELIAEIQFTPDFLTGNTKMILKLISLARRAGYLTQMEDAFGRQVNAYNGIPLINTGNYYSPVTNKTEFVVPIAANGTTDLYAARFGIDSLHGVSPVGDKVIKTYSDGLDTTGVIRKVGVEAAMAIALKNSLSAGVLRNIKVQAGA